MVVSRAIPLRDVYSKLDAPILIMLTRLTPIADLLRTTDGTEIIAS